jgi:hypothetical protein
VKCKLDLKQIEQLECKSYRGQDLPKCITLLSDRRDVNIEFDMWTELEVWVAAVQKYGGESVAVLIE